MQTTTTPKGQVDLTQDPQDFMKVLKGEKEVIPPPESSAAGDSKEHLQDNGKIKPDEKISEVKETSTPVKPSTEAVDETKTETPNSVDEQRHRDAAKIIQQKSEERKRTLFALVEIAKNDPSQLAIVAKYDKKLADDAVRESFGFSSLQEYQDSLHVERIREEDPDRAATEERLLKLERRDSARAETLEKELRDKFLESKGISNNQFDPTFISLQEKLSLLNPQFVAEHYTDALATAYGLMSPNTPPINAKQVEIEKALSEKSAPSPTGAIRQGYGADSSHEANQHSFAQNLGITLNS